MRPIVFLIVLSAAAAEAQTPATTETPAATPTPEAAPTPATDAAHAPAVVPEVTSRAVTLAVSGALWPTYRFDMTEGAQDTNEFDVSRAYLTFVPKISDEIDGRITIDVVSQGPGEDSTGEEVDTNTTGSLVMRLKYGYFRYRPFSFVEMQAGMVPTPWIAYEESVYGYRLLGETGAAAYWGIKSSDLGYGVKLKAFGGRLFVHSQAQNGETYSKRETNKYKEIATLASVQVIPRKEGGLKVGAYYGYSLRDQDADKVRAVGIVSWQSALGMANAGYVMAQDGDGAGTHVTGGGPFAAAFVNLPFALPRSLGTRVIGRVDVVDPDADIEDDSLTRAIGAVSVICHDKAQVALEYQIETFESADVEPRKMAFVRWDLRF